MPTKPLTFFVAVLAAAFVVTGSPPPIDSAAAEPAVSRTAVEATSTTTTTSPTTTTTTTTTTTLPQPQPERACGLGCVDEQPEFHFDELETVVIEVLTYLHADRHADSVLRWIPDLIEYDWPIEEALAIIDCESDGNPNAVNPTSRTTGLFQVHPENLSGSNIHVALRPIRGDPENPDLSRRSAAMEWLKDATNNIEAAYLIYAKNRDIDKVPWREWTCRHAALRLRAT